MFREMFDDLIIDLQDHLPDHGIRLSLLLGGVDQFGNAFLDRVGHVAPLVIHSVPVLLNQLTDAGGYPFQPPVDLALPHAKHRPAVVFQAFVDETVSGPVAAQLLLPEGRIADGRNVVARAAVPETSVYKDGDARSHESKVRSGIRDSWMFPVPESDSPQIEPEPEFRRGVALADRLHDPASHFNVETILCHVGPIPSRRRAFSQRLSVCSIRGGASSVSVSNDTRTSPCIFVKRGGTASPIMARSSDTPLFFKMPPQSKAAGIV